jgi:hypothetical protein
VQLHGFDRRHGEGEVLFDVVPGARLAQAQERGRLMPGRRPRLGEPGYVDERATTGRRGYSWPPFEPGNEMALRHGALSERKVDPIAAQLAAELVRDRPDLQRFPEAVAAWSRAEARCLLLESWFADHGLLDDEGKATASERLLASSERLAMQLRERLGLDPKSEAELAQSQADAARSVVDLDALRARGREALRARRALESAERLRGDDEQLHDGEDAT